MSSIVLSEEQQAVLRGLVDWMSNPDSSQVSTLGGLAGTGKSTLVGELRKACSAVLGDPPVILAPTGKAVEVLRRKGNLGARTVHQYVYDFKGKSDDGKLQFEAKETTQMGDTLAIVDEASMMSARMCRDLEAFHRGPVLYVGDHGQLPPVDYGSGNSVVSNPKFELKTVHRQALDNPVIALAHMVRVGNTVSDPVLFNEFGGYAINDGAECKRVYDEGLQNNFRDLQLLTFRNKRRVQLNQKIRKELKRTPTAIDPGDKIIFLENKGGVFNGQQVIVDRMEDGFLVFDTDSWVNVNFDCLNVEKPDLVFDGKVSCDFAYALTCHKAQGSQYPKVMINLMPKDVGMLRSSGMYNKWMYTAITRAESEVYIHISK